MDQDPCDASPPNTWGLSLTDIFARYMVSRFNSAISSETDPGYTEIPRELSVAAVCEADRMVRILLEAYHNKGRTSGFSNRVCSILTVHLVVIDTIDIIRLGEKANKSNSQSMKDKTPDDLDRDLQIAEEGLERLTEPCVITDRSDYILLWYLPGLVSDPNQVSIVIRNEKKLILPELHLEPIVHTG
jgi:hypothetical protein